jgi:HK97 family phage prohead protease
MSTNKEVRAFHSDSIELRKAAKASDNEQKFVDGVGVIYDKEVELWDGYFERIDKNAFKECLSKNPEIKSFFNHDPNYVLSTNTSNPALVISDLGDGLFFSSPIPDTSYGRDLEENLKRKNVIGASFTFSVNRDNVTVDEKGCYHRTILDATIYEVGPVTNPAYVQTQVSLRDKDSLLDEAKKRTNISDVAELTEIRDRENEYRRNLISLLEINN